LNGRRRIGAKTEASSKRIELSTVATNNVAPVPKITTTTEMEDETGVVARCAPFLLPNAPRAAVFVA